MADPRKGTQAVAPPPRDLSPGGRTPAEKVLRPQIEALKLWAHENGLDARRDFVKFWLFKATAFAGAAGSSIFAAFEYHQAVIVLGAISALSVAVDGLARGGYLHDVHKRAEHEIMRLVHDISSKLALLDTHTPPLTGQDLNRQLCEVVEKINAERDRITKQLTAGEASLNALPAPDNSPRTL